MRLARIGRIASLDEAAICVGSQARPNHRSYWVWMQMVVGVETLAWAVKSTRNPDQKARREFGGQVHRLAG